VNELALHERLQVILMEVKSVNLHFQENPLPASKPRRADVHEATSRRPLDTQYAFSCEYECLCINSLHDPALALFGL
jgi:hypothetical protein